MVRAIWIRRDTGPPWVWDSCSPFRFQLRKGGLREAGDLLSKHRSAQDYTYSSSSTLKPQQSYLTVWLSCLITHLCTTLYFPKIPPWLGKLFKKSCISLLIITLLSRKCLWLVVQVACDVLPFLVLLSSLPRGGMSPQPWRACPQKLISILHFSSGIEQSCSPFFWDVVYCPTRDTDAHPMITLQVWHGGLQKDSTVWNSLYSL